jgi:hypothetical protein
MIHFASYVTTKIVVRNQIVGHTNNNIMVWTEFGGLFCRILSIPQNIVMDLNSVMKQSA